MLFSGQFLTVAYSKLQLVIWFAITALELYLVVLVFWRKVFVSLPLFSTYICFILLKGGALWLLYAHRAGALYYWVFWTSEVLTLMFAFLIIWELFGGMLEAFPTMATFCRATLLLVLSALLLTCLLPEPLTASGVTRSFVLLQRSMRYVQAGLLVCLFAMAGYFRLPLNSWQRGIALGYGVYAALELANYALVAHLWLRYERAWSVTSQLSYLLALLLWSYYLTVPARLPEARAGALPSGELVELEAAIRGRMEEVNRALWALLRGRQA